MFIIINIIIITKIAFTEQFLQNVKRSKQLKKDWMWCGKLALIHYVSVCRAVWSITVHCLSSLVTEYHLPASIASPCTSCGTDHVTGKPPLRMRRAPQFRVDVVVVRISATFITQLRRLDCTDVTEYWRINGREKSLCMSESCKVCVLAKTGSHTHTCDGRTDGQTHTHRETERETSWLTEIVLSCNKYYGNVPIRWSRQFRNGLKTCICLSRARRFRNFCFVMLLLHVLLLLLCY